MKRLSIKLLFVASAFLVFSCSTAKKANKSKKTDATAMAKPAGKKPAAKTATKAAPAKKTAAKPAAKKPAANKPVAK